MGAGMYHIRVVGELDSTKIRAELARLSKTKLMVGVGGVGAGGGKGGKGNGIVQLGKDAEQTSKRLKGLNGQVIQNDKKLKGMHRGFANTSKEVEKSNSKLRAFGNESLNVTKKVVQFGAITAVIRGVTSGMADMVQNTFELDAALTEFRKVSNLSEKELERYTDQAYKAGRQTARTGTEMIDAATQFKKMGYSDQQSMQLATTATMFQNIADAEISAGDAALFINSQLKAFNFSADESQHVIGAVNEVANQFAVGTNDLQLALSKTASAMGGFGNSFEQTIGIITAGTEIMVGQPSKVARGWRTIGANIAKLAKETDTYSAASGKVNIEMRKQDGTMKNTYEFLSDLHEQWGNLNNEQKTAIALQLGGKNQMEVFLATMNNFDTALDATNTAMGEQNSAAKENAKYLESLAGHLSNLKSAWEEFSYTMVSSNALKKGMDVLAGALRFLASDAGKFVMLGTGIATTLNLIAKAALGLKGLSLVKLFSGLGGVLTGTTKGAKGATDALKVMQGAQVGAASGAGKLASAFMRVGGGLLGPVGLVTAIGLASVALAKYVDIGEKAKDIRVTKALKEAQTDVEKTEKKYKSLSDELDKLHEKEKEGTLTDSEQNRLNILENQTKQLERQLELKKELAVNEADEYYHTVDPSKLEGKAKDKYTLAKSAGKSDKEALAAAGIHDKIALALNNEQAQAEKTASAQQKVTEAYEHYGKESSQYKDALEDLDKAQKAQGDSLSQLEKDRKKAIEYYGSEEEANKRLGKSWKDLNKEISALRVLKGLNFEKPSKDLANLKKNAKSLGIQFTKTGKSIKHIDLSTFTTEMTEAGYSVEDTWRYLKALGKENPKATVNIDGTDVAIEDLEFVDGKIQKVDETEAKVDIEAEDNASAKMDKIKKDKNLGKAKKKLEESGGNKVDATMGKLTKRSNLGKAKKNIEQKGAEGVQNKLNTISNKKNLGKANKNITQKGGDSVQNKLNTISGKNSLGTATKTIKFSLSGAVGAAKKFLGLKKGIRHFAAGGTSSILDNAEVNEQGFEIIQDGKTGLMRVANGGKRGTTRLNKGDTVYTHGQSVRMLQKAGTSEGKSIYGYNKDEIGLFGIGKLPRFAKGKTTPLTQKQYTSQYNAILSTYDKDLATLEYEKEKYHWSEKKFVNKYIKLKKNYNKKISKLNKKSVEKGVERRTTLGVDRLRALELAKAEVKHSGATSGISGYIEGHRLTNKELSKSLKKIRKARKAQKISAEEATQYRKEAYKKNLEYNIKLYENDDKTYKSTLKLLKSYYNKAKITSAEYYQYREELAKTQLEKEKERLSKQQSLNQDTYSLAKGYVQKQIDLLEKENEEQEKQNELVELQNNLVKARNQKIRIYKEGEGFVYEQDTEAIREATQALQEYQSTAENPVLAEWKKVLELFDEYETDAELKALENSVGSTVGKLFGSLGTDPSAWAKWIKNNLSKTQGLQDVLNDMDKLVDANDIIKYLNKNGNVSDTIINDAIKNNALPSTYASAITQSALEAQASLNATTNLATQSSISGATSKIVGSGVSTQYGNIYNFDNLVLPNVTNASQFINELDNLSTIALQVTTQRV